jgi:hypothetical protein
MSFGSFYLTGLFALFYSTCPFSIPLEATSEMVGVPKRDRSAEEGQVDKRGERGWGRDIGFASENEGANVFYRCRLLQPEATSEMI